MNLEDQRFLRSLGARVRECRAARRLTQADLGERCGLHRTFIGSVERGERNVSILNLRLIARVLRVALAELLADAAEEGKPVSEIADLLGLTDIEVRARALRIIGRLQAGRRRGREPDADLVA